VPYDRKTELLWNYIGMAQFSDLSRIWGQGPATIRGDATVGYTPQTIVIRTDEAPDSDEPKHHVTSGADGDIPSSSSGSEGVASPVTDAELENPVKIDIATFMPSASVGHSSHSSSDVPVSFGNVSVHSGHLSHFEITHQQSISTSSMSSDTSPHASAEILSDDAGLAIDNGPPKFYGPSEVNATSAIDGGDNTQTSSVTVEGNPDAAPSGWTGVGAEDVASIIDQLTAASQNNGYNFIIDYVSGNLTSLFSMQQLNTIYDNDSSHNSSYVTAAEGSLLGDVNVSQSIISGGNESTNTAYMASGDSLDNYDVLVVTGDLTEINKIVQVNLIVDDDVNQATSSADVDMPYGSASSVWDAAIKSGGNTEVNLAFIIDQDSGSVYLVGGYYGSSTSVTQTNILSDDDINEILQLFHSQEGTGFLGFNVDGVITSGGDSQTNIAHIVGEDGASGSLPDNATHDLTSLLAFANLHPGDGDIHVLFVDGNYTIVNLVVQINVIQDADTNIVESHADGAMGQLTDPNPVVVADSPAEDGTTATTDADHQQGSDANGADGTENSHEEPPSNDSTGGVSATGESGPGQQEHETDTAPVTTSGEEQTATADTGSTNEAENETADSHHDDGSSTVGHEETPEQLPVYADSGSLHYDQLIDSGGNGATNVAVLVDGGGGPQLRIVQGHYYEYNSIDQLNILVDSDHNHVTSAMNTDIPGGGETIASNTTDATHLTSADDMLNRMTG